LLILQFTSGACVQAQGGHGNLERAESQPHTQHTNRLLSEPPTYYWGRLFG